MPGYLHVVEMTGLLEYRAAADALALCPVRARFGCCRLLICLTLAAAVRTFGIGVRRWQTLDATRTPSAHARHTTHRAEHDYQDKDVRDDAFEHE